MIQKEKEFKRILKESQESEDNKRRNKKEDEKNDCFHKRGKKIRCHA